ncbi:uncharacterized protein PRCAT00004089001 [Priceomyces carsonii]|uniref:uncharacterized protein n=1 Tax=Priceomyces carsonii TaxID=28549 RepID=UPI002ED9F5D8|nr:unnamed protein product [Priceomyces carsonii]
MGSGTTSSIFLGCSVAIISSAIQSLGITLQRKSHLLHSHSTSHYHIQKYKRNMWLFGFILFIIANVLGSLIQITTLPLIILSPLQSIGLIFNSILSCMLLPGESFTRKLGWGTVFISGGAFMIAYNGSTAPESPPGKEHVDKRFALIIKKLMKKSFLSWFIGTFFIIAVLLFINYMVSRRMREIKFKLQKRRNRLLKKAVNKLHFVKGINYGLISGTLTAHTFLFAKSLIDVIIESIMSQNHDFKQVFASSNFTPYFLLIVMLLIIGCQLTAFNLGLSQISTSILYPLCFLVYNLVNLFNDLLFNSLLADHKMSFSQLFLVLLGLSGVLFGVVLISWDSAFGHNIKLDPFLSPEEAIIYSKFPYSDINMNKETRVLLNQNISTSSFDNHDAQYSSIDSSATIRMNSISEDQNYKGDVSYEQLQLLHLLDI